MRETWRDYVFGDQESLQARANLAEQIDAELRDHLELIADRLRHQGLPADIASAKAEQAFGPVASIRRSCLWIQQGDLIMYRALTVAGMGLIGLGLMALAFVGMRLQESIASSSAQLQTIVADLRTGSGPTPAVRDRGSIEGKVYLRSPQTPASRVDLRLIRMEDGQIMRRCQSDEAGHFRFDEVPLADYSVLARGVGPEKKIIENSSDESDVKIATWCVQSATQGLTRSAADARLELDVLLPLVDIRLELDESVPEIIEVGDRQVYLNTYVCLIHPGLRTLPWTPATSTGSPSTWPMVGWDLRKERYGMGSDFGGRPELDGSDVAYIGPGVFLHGRDLASRTKHATWPPKHLQQVLQAGTYRVAAVTVAFLDSNDDVGGLTFGRGLLVGGGDEFSLPTSVLIGDRYRPTYFNSQGLPPGKSPHEWCLMTGKTNDPVTGTPNNLIVLYSSNLPLTDIAVPPDTRMTVTVAPPPDWIEGIRQALADPDIAPEALGDALELQLCKCTMREEPIPLPSKP